MDLQSCNSRVCVQLDLSRVNARGLVKSAGGLRGSTSNDNHDADPLNLLKQDEEDAILGQHFKSDGTECPSSWMCLNCLLAHWMRTMSFYHPKYKYLPFFLTLIRSLGCFCEPRPTQCFWQGPVRLSGMWRQHNIRAQSTRLNCYSQPQLWRLTTFFIVRVKQAHVACKSQHTDRELDRSEIFIWVALFWMIASLDLSLPFTIWPLGPFYWGVSTKTRYFQRDT